MTTEKLKLEILYEDNHLIAVFKPAGVLVQGNRPVGERNEPTLMDEVKEYLKEKYKKPGNVFLGLVHRLDRPVSGIILFAKTSKGAARISEQIREREMRKIYHAVVDGQMKSPSGTLRNFLKKDEEKRIAKIVKEREGDLAELDYETVKTNGKISLLKIELKTGRFHQIRVQLSAIGHPIVGDSKYGSKIKYKDGQIALSAVGLAFKTATTDEIKNIKIDYPKEFEVELQSSTSKTLLKQKPPKGPRMF